MYREPLVVPPSLGRDSVLQLMRANRFHQLPVVDERRRVVGLHVWDELLAAVPARNLMVIMAGGQGSGCDPHTESCPKPLLRSAASRCSSTSSSAPRRGFQEFRDRDSLSRRR